MLKIYSRFKLKDWIYLVIILGFTVLQVYTTMCLVDYVSGITKAITYLNYHNNPSLLGEGITKLMSTLAPDGNINTFWSGVKGLISSGSIPGLDSSMIDTLSSIADASTDDIWFNGGMMVLVAFGNMACQVVIAFLASSIASDFATNLREELNMKVSSFSLEEINKFSTSSLITRTTNDIEQVQMTSLMMMRMVFSAPVTAIWALCKIQASSSQLTLTTAIAIIIMIISLGIVVFFAMPKFKKIQSYIDRLNGITQENLNGIRPVRAYNGETYQEEKFDKANLKLTKVQIFTGRITDMISPIMTLIMSGLTLAIYWIGAILINRGEINFPTVTSFIMLASQIIMAFVMLLMMFIMLPRANVCAKRINEVLGTKNSIVDPVSSKPLTEHGSVEFKNVCFRYPGMNINLINDISFKIEKGQTLAFIGATGSGKTSIINLITRLYDASEGEVIVDGVNVKDLTQKQLRELIGYVPQKGVLFSGSVRYNISFGSPNLTLDECKKAASIACASEFIEKMDQGYDSNIARGGSNVSGGQKQRLCIARAVAINPEIFIFDDSFSALDFKTDKQLRNNLKENFKDSTKIIVAQRIGTIMDADKIIVLQDGQAVGMGTHKELLQTCQQYKEIALSQLSKEELGL